jgi:hypothetical protein
VIESTLPYPAEPPPPVAPAEAPKPAAPDRLALVDTGFFQPRMFLQPWFIVTRNDKQNGTDSTFRIRRAEFGAKGELVPKVLRYNLMFDVAKTPAFTAATRNVPVTSTDPNAAPATVAVPQPVLGADRSPLQDVWITYISDYADVTIGQFKIPVGLEALQPTARLLFPERARVVGAFGDRRDIGLKIDKKIGDYFYYNVGIYNGQGQNVTDTDHPKDLGVRLEVYPIPGLTIGGVAYGTIGERELGARDRFEGDLRLELADLIVQGEYIHGWTGPEARHLEGHGAYGEVGYTIAKLVQPAVRVGFLDVNIDDVAPAANADTERGALRIFEVAVNYLGIKSYDAKVGVALAYYSQENDLAGDVTEVIFHTLCGF